MTAREQIIYALATGGSRGREAELTADELYEHIKYPKRSRKAFEGALLSLQEDGVVNAWFLQYQLDGSVTDDGQVRFTLDHPFEASEDEIGDYDD